MRMKKELEKGELLLQQQPQPKYERLIDWVNRRPNYTDQVVMVKWLTGGVD